MSNVQSVRSDTLPSTESSLTSASVTGYDRASVDRFFAEVAAVRQQLIDQIAAARRRAAQARASLTTQQTLVFMMKSALDEIAAKQRQAAIILSRLEAAEPVPERTDAEPPTPAIRWRAAEPSVASPRIVTTAGAR